MESNKQNSNNYLPTCQEEARHHWLYPKSEPQKLRTHFLLWLGKGNGGKHGDSTPISGKVKKNPSQLGEKEGLTHSVEVHRSRTREWGEMHEVHLSLYSKIPALLVPIPWKGMSK